MQPEIAYKVELYFKKQANVKLYHCFVVARPHGQINVVGETLSLGQMESARIALSARHRASLNQQISLP